MIATAAAIAATAILSLRSMIFSTRAFEKVQLFFCHEELATAAYVEACGGVHAVRSEVRKHCMERANSGAITARRAGRRAPAPSSTGLARRRPPH
jgi:hypothetical protein